MGFASPVREFSVPGPHFPPGPATPQTTSPTFPSQVLLLSVPSLWASRPRSSLFPGTCDTTGHQPHIPVPGPDPFHGPATVLLRTRNTTGHQPHISVPGPEPFHGPATVILRTCNTTEHQPHFSVPGPPPSRPRSVGFPSPVLTFPLDPRHHRPPTPHSRPWSATVPSQVRTFPSDRRRRTPPRPHSRPRSRTISQTGDSTSPDLQRNRPPTSLFRPRSSSFPSPVPNHFTDRRQYFSGPATQLSRTGDTSALKHTSALTLRFLCFRPIKTEKIPNFTEL